MRFAFFFRNFVAIIKNHTHVCFNRESNDCENHFERRIYVLKNMEVLERIPWAAQSAGFQRLAEVAEVSKLSKEDRIKYDYAP